MAKVMDLVNALDANAKDYDNFLEDLLSVNDDLPSNVDEVNSLQNAIISHVNSRLNQSATRHDGLKLLSHLLPKCSKDALTKYAVLWITKASQTLENSRSNQGETTLACKVLAKLVTLCKDVTELQKHVSMQTVKQLVLAVFNLETDRRCGAAFYLIAAILYHYKEPSERLQTSIRKMILPLIDSDQKTLVNAGANCYTLLARATERSFKPPPNKPTYTGWVYSQALLCNSLHAIMDDLFAGMVELEAADVWEKLELQEISRDNVMEYYCALERRFGNLCNYLSTMLRGCAGRNSVSPNDILQVLCRGLAVTPGNLTSFDSFKRQMLCFILPKLHVSLFTVLNAFIDGFKQELVPFAITILQLYQQTLKWTDKTGENQTTISGAKPFKNVRIAVYKSLTMWLSCLGALSGIEIVSDEFLPHILKDITPEKERVLLTVQKTQHLSKRALKRFKDSQYENSASLGSANVVAKNPCINAELCKMALTTLENIFFGASSTLKQSFYITIQNTIVPLLYDYYLGKHEENFYRSNENCRLCLLKALKSIQMNPHPSTPPPTQYSIELFGMALKDVDLSIVREAKLALSEIEKIAHPSAPTLLLPLRNNVEESEKRFGIHWKRPEQENQISRGKGEAREEINVWERFREARNESIIENEGREDDEKSIETSEVEPKERANNSAASIDGPTPSKQPKIHEISELMDTSEDELTTSPRKNESSPRENSISDVFSSPRKKNGSRFEENAMENHRKAMKNGLEEMENNCEEMKNNSEAMKNNSEAMKNNSEAMKNRSSGKNDEIPDSMVGKIRENDPCDSSVTAIKKTENDNEKAGINNEDVISNGKADKSARQIEQCLLEDNSDDEALMSLFCDELKDT